MVPSLEISQPPTAERDIAIITAAAATRTPSLSTLDYSPAASRAAEHPNLFNQPAQSTSDHTGCWLRAKLPRAGSGEMLLVRAFVRM